MGAMRDVGSIFQSTLPAREATKGLIDLAYRSGISIHASREGSDCPVSVAGDGAGVISIHASREGSDLADDAAALLLDISIHASREGSDLLAAFDGAFHHDFNPRFPRGKRLLNSLYSFSCWLFQSTLPAREATHRSHPPRWGRNHFNPRFPRGKRPQADVQHDVRLHFNPRFPRGKRLCNPVFPLLQERFQSTLPAREATSRTCWKAPTRQISIHASREGSDRSNPILCGHGGNFNPRFPRGKRPCAPPIARRCPTISIHASREGSDASGQFWLTTDIISIHASREGSDHLPTSRSCGQT